MKNTLAFDAYTLCGTPRSGSTLLCKMLAATGVSGRPHSFFRAEDIVDWAASWGLAAALDPATAAFDRAYLAAMLAAGRGGTDLFGVRIMWASVVDATRRMNSALGTDLDFAAAIERAFGRTLFIHVSRNDKVAQAVSRLKAEQSGLWHLRADGSVLEGPDKPDPVHYDGKRIRELVEELISDDAAWSSFFLEQGIEPMRLVYETVTEAPQAALQAILGTLGLDASRADAVSVPTRKIADEESRAWIERFKAEKCG